MNRRLTGKVPHAGKDWGQKEKTALEDEMAGWHHWCNGHELGQTLGDAEGQGGLACYSPWDHKESNRTGRLNNNNNMILISKLSIPFYKIYVSIWHFVCPYLRNQKQFIEFTSSITTLGNILHLVITAFGLPRWLSGKESASQWRSLRRHMFEPWLGKIPWRREWQPTPVFLPGESHGQRRLAGYGQWGHKESDTT